MGELLIADDVGLGKTVSGLVIQELLIRHRARRILIICPAALMPANWPNLKWRLDEFEILCRLSHFQPHYPIPA
jgi:hypothetical protein